MITLTAMKYKRIAVSEQNGLNRQYVGDEKTRNPKKKHRVQKRVSEEGLFIWGYSKAIQLPPSMRHVTQIICECDADRVLINN